MILVPKHTGWLHAQQYTTTHLDIFCFSWKSHQHKIFCEVGWLRLCALITIVWESHKSRVSRATEIQKAHDLAASTQSIPWSTLTFTEIAAYIYIHIHIFVLLYNQHRICVQMEHNFAGICCMKCFPASKNGTTLAGEKFHLSSLRFCILILAHKSPEIFLHFCRCNWSQSLQIWKDWWLLFKVQITNINKKRKKKILKLPTSLLLVAIMARNRGVANQPLRDAYHK